MRYAVWNNKGGVGKTFLSFVVAAEYAERNPNTLVIVADLCPQANVSEILLGGNGSGAEKLDELLGQKPRVTVGGYFDRRISSPHKKTGDEGYFLTDLGPINDRLPQNMALLAGDPSLEIQSQAMSQIAGLDLPKGAWRNVHAWLSDLLDEVEKGCDGYDKTAVFIDCNPSFSAYTELALLAADRVIVPCTADGSSARAIDNIGQLLFGLNTPDAYGDVGFAHRANAFGMSVPVVHLVTLNRSTRFNKKATKAFNAMYEEVKKRTIRLREEHASGFSEVANLFLELPDAHSASVVSSHTGTPLSRLKMGSHSVHGTMCQVNRDPLELYRKHLSEIVDAL